MAELIDYCLKNWAQLAAAAVLIGMFALGYARGLVRMSVGLASIVSSLIITKLLLPMVTAWADRNMLLRTVISGRVNDMLGYQQTQEEAKSGVDVFYDLIGLNRLTEFIGQKTAEFVVSVATFVVLLILVSIAVKILFKALDLITKLPGLSFLNRMLGGILGLAEGFLYIWIFLLVISIIPENALTVSAAKQFSAPDSWLSYVREANLFTHIFGAMLS